MNAKIINLSILCLISTACFTAQAADPASLSATEWQQLSLAIEKGNVAATKILAQKGGSVFEEIPKGGGILVGFDLIITPFDKSENTVRGIAPVFQTRDKQVTGATYGSKKGKATTQLLAKPGYAVGKVTATYDGVAIRTLKVRFDRIDGLKLNVKDSYESPWIGTYDSASTSEGSIDSRGRLPVGLSGQFGLGIDGLRLVFLFE